MVIYMDIDNARHQAGHTTATYWSMLIIWFQSPYEVDVPEDEIVGTTILRNIQVEDKDSVGDNLEVDCVPNEQVMMKSSLSAYKPQCDDRKIHQSASDIWQLLISIFRVP